MHTYSMDRHILDDVLKFTKNKNGKKRHTFAHCTVDSFVNVFLLTTIRVRHNAPVTRAHHNHLKCSDKLSSSRQFFLCRCWDKYQ